METNTSNNDTPQKYGVENLKKFLKFACDLTKQIATSTADGWQWTDALSFIDEAAAIPGVVKNFGAIKQELSELSPSEREELHAYLVEEFDIPNDQVEAWVEEAIGVVINLVSLVEKWKSLKAAKG